jgi:hypothetical protein
MIRLVTIIQPDLRDALRRLSKRTGAPVSELVRRAIAAYVRTRGRGEQVEGQVRQEEVQVNEQDQ